MVSDSSVGVSDQKIVKNIECAILENVGNISSLKINFPKLIRKAIDEVIDTPRTGRLLLEQIEKTEKTYIGTKVEILFRSFIGFPKGILDLNVNGIDVDIKNTVTGNWMIPTEAVGKPCILIEVDEEKALCSLGIIVARLDYLNKGVNRDKKRSISSEGRKKIHWLLKKHPYPASFWRGFDQKKALEVFQLKQANARLELLFKESLKRPIPRAVIEDVSQPQKDYMKRLRKNGGARDTLAMEGIAILSGAYDQVLIKQLGLTKCAKDEFISYKIASEHDRLLLKDKLS